MFNVYKRIMIEMLFHIPIHAYISDNGMLRDLFNKFTVCPLRPRFVLYADN